jgi:predicted nucleic acid-binding protein
MRVLADTSIWVAHFRSANRSLQTLLANDQVLCHPLVLVELACGTPPAPRDRTLAELKKLQQAAIATTDEVLSLVESHRCYDAGCGAIDVALLASVLLTPDTRLWTVDKDLIALATRLRVAFDADFSDR